MAHRRWNVGRIAFLGAVTGTLLVLFRILAPAFGGAITGLAFWGRLAAGAVVGALALALVALVRNLLVARRARPDTP